MKLKQRLNPLRFVRGEALPAGPVVLNHRRIFILPTRWGWGFSILLLLLLAASVVYNNNLGLILTFLLASIFVISLLHSFRTLSGLRIHPGRCEPVFAGSSAEFELRVENPQLFPRQDLQLALKQNQPVWLSLAPASTLVVSLPVVAEKRGWLISGTITVCTVYPLGLCRAWSPLRFDLRILVYPAPAKNAAPLPQAGTGFAGKRASQPDPEDFYGFRSYRPGDSLKHVYWQGVAKGRGVHTKQYLAPQSSSLWLDLEQMPGPHLEQRLSQLCRAVLDAERNGLCYGLKLPGQRISPATGDAHRDSCLSALALC